MSSNINPPLVSYLISSFITLRRQSTSSVTQIASYLSVSRELSYFLCNCFYKTVRPYGMALDSNYWGRRCQVACSEIAVWFSTRIFVTHYSAVFFQCIGLGQGTSDQTRSDQRFFVKKTAFDVHTKISHFQNIEFNATAIDFRITSIKCTTYLSCYRSIKNIYTFLRKKKFEISNFVKKPNKTI